jgi:hypothetical protein
VSEPRKTIKPILKEATEDENLPKLQIEIQNDPKNLAENGLSPEEHYLQRKMEVTKRDHEEFVAYLEEKRSREEQKRAERQWPAPRSGTQVVISRPPVSTKPCREYEPSRGRYFGETSMDREAERAIDRPPQPLENRLAG